MKRALIAAFFILFFSVVFAEEEHRLEKIVVTPGGLFSAGPSKYDYSAQVLDSSDIKEKNPDFPAALLDGVPGVDLRYRSPGIQGDLSVRGSTYEQVAVLIDGIKINDPQTGHHNLDIPLTVFDLEKLEIIKDGDSSLYGAGALAGSANFIVKKPLKKALKLDAVFGEHALFGQALSLSLPHRQLSGRVSFEHKISKAARSNTDFEYRTASLYLDKELNDSALDLLFGYQKKDFGADSFYSNLFPEEEEHTETIFTKTGLENRLTIGSLRSGLFFRRHRDKFILTRNNPTSVNYHTTYIYGLKSYLNAPTRPGEFIFGLDAVREKINSTNLDKHTRLYEAISAGFIPQLMPGLSADFRARADHYRKWGWQESYNCGLGYDIIADKLNINGSAGRSFRIPSFTELYYSNAANKGNPDLGIERSDNFRLGLNFKNGQVELGIGGFYRRGYNLIDWTRSSQQEAWLATNLGRVDFAGGEFIWRFRPQAASGNAALQKIMLSYNYMDADKKADGFFSKYALDILKHQILLDIYSVVFGLKVDWQLSYNQRYYGETYFTGNFYLGKKITNRNLNFEPFVRIDNFSDTKYSEVSGVLLPGRWVKSGIKFEW